ncbi:hypothetical protein BV898_11177 [Hypsibius exemplaris]|uniref:Uncharacterized protein n=1 Tax=Hypsibius exemplaris TaxID=2072580 RepID=A0A1W0WHI9_HYPEX|nr:hypothetical protein BV898_11177 [Hypsibius exemplaris]
MTENSKHFKLANATHGEGTSVQAEAPVIIPTDTQCVEDTKDLFRYCELPTRCKIRSVRHVVLHHVDVGTSDRSWVNRALWYTTTEDHWTGSGFPDLDAFLWPYPEAQR